VLLREDAIDGSYVVVFKEGVGNGGATNLKGRKVYSKDQLKKIAAEYGGEVTSVWTDVIDGFAGTMSEEAASRLADHPDVQYVEQETMTYPTQSVTWGIDRVDQRELPLNNEYNPRNDGSGVTSYIIDSGVRITHEEFEGRAEWGTNIIDDNDTDCNGHGTHVAGTVAGALYGVGKDTKIVAVKIFPCSGGTATSNTIAAMNWVAADAAANPDTPATCNMSLGGGYNQASNDAAAALVDSGVVTVVAAGNDNGDACNKSPASEPKVITVGSTTNTDSRSWFSNYGTCVDIFAPGSSITAAWYTSNTATNTISGTSMASPHVCGVAGLALAAGVAVEDVTDELINGATPDVVTDPRPGSPNLLVFAGNIVPTVSPAPSMHFPSVEPSKSPSPSNTPSIESSSAPSVSAIPSSSPTVCENDFFKISIVTDRWYTETSWDLEDTCLDQTFKSVFKGFYTERDTLYVQEFCAPQAESVYKFVIYDSFGDGICCSHGNGSYEITLNDAVVASGGNFGASEESIFGADECPLCAGDIIGVSILTDNWPGDISYQIKDDCNDEILWSRPSLYFSSANNLYEDEVCTPSTGSKYTFTIFDAFGDGLCCGEGEGYYEVTLNGELKGSGGDFGALASETFGSCLDITCVDADLLVPFQGNLISCNTIVNAGGCSNPLAPTHCPLGCGECDTYQCEDSEAPWAFGGNTYDCSLLAAQDPDMITNYCDTLSGLTTTCRETCGYCLA